MTAVLRWLNEMISGFGFASVSLVASVRYLPKNKSGIGSGIVNAARQIGTCLGIAVLVTVLDTNIDTAKTQIHHASDQIVTEKVLSPYVRCAAPPAPAIMILIPFFRAFCAYSTFVFNQTYAHCID